MASALADVLLRANAPLGPVRDNMPLASLPPSMVAGQQNWDALKGAGKTLANTLLINPGYELGGSLQNIAEGQGGFSDYLDAGMNAAGAVPGAGALKGLMAAGKFTPAMFAGILAKTADRGALATAEKLAAKGAPKEQIWNETGWFKGADDKWRFEIPDDKAKLNPHLYTGRLPEFGTPAKMAGEMWHPPFYAAYPDARNVKMRVEAASQPHGSYYQAAGDASVGAVPVIHTNAPDAAAGRSVALHEMQHDIQSREAFAKGSSQNAELQHLSENTGNPIIEQLRSAISTGQYGRPGEKTFMDAAKSLLELERQSRADRAMQAYRATAGEVESRNVQHRMDMTPEQRRAAPPWTTEDVPREQQIVRY